MTDLDPRDDMIAELRAIASQRIAEADAMRAEMVQLRRILGAEGVVADQNERLRAERDALAATIERVRALPDLFAELCASVRQTGQWTNGYKRGLEHAAADIRAALDDNGGSDEH